MLLVGIDEVGILRAISTLGHGWQKSATRRKNWTLHYSILALAISLKLLFVLPIVIRSESVLHWFLFSLFRRLFPMFVCAEKIWDASKSSMTIVRTLHHFWASVNGPWRVWNKTYVHLKLTKTQCFRKEHRLLRMTFPFIEMFPFKSALWLCCSRS